MGATTGSSKDMNINNDTSANIIQKDKVKLLYYFGQKVYAKKKYFRTKSMYNTSTCFFLRILWNHISFWFLIAVLKSCNVFIKYKKKIYT